jgi:hypothetical protein
MLREPRTDLKREAIPHALSIMPFRIVQPYGRDVGGEATTISEHRTVSEAFAEIDRSWRKCCGQTAGPRPDLAVVDAARLHLRR